MKARLDEENKEETWVKTNCYMCYNTCGIRVKRVNGVAVSVEGDPDNPQNLGMLCAKGGSALVSLYNPNRVTKPLKRTNPRKGLGEDPRWVETSWEEAMSILLERLSRVRESDPRKMIISTFDLQLAWFTKAFAAAFGTPNIWYAAAGFYCGNGYHPVQYMTHGTWMSEPDLDYCKYCILIGTNSGFVINHLPMMEAKKMATARLNGMKLVVVDPMCNNSASQANEWVPILPGTDAAFALGMANTLVNELDIYDAGFLKKHTNAPYLIREDGRYQRDLEGKPLIWDLKGQKAKSYDDPSLKDLALEGDYEVEDAKCTTTFQRLRTHLRNYSAERVSEITSVPASTIRRIAKGFGEAASIGSTIEIDGQTLPYRPALVNYYKGPSQHKHGMLNGIAIQLLNTLIGAIDVPGGHLGTNPVGPNWSPKTGPDGLLVPDGELRGPPSYPLRRVARPENAELVELFPVASYSRPMFLVNLMEPKYGLPYQPEVIINCRTNFVHSTANPEQVIEAVKKVPFMVTMTSEMNETAEIADIVLPDAHFLERLDAFVNGQHWMHAGLGQWYWLYRIPVVKPMGEARHWAEMLLEVANRMGFSSHLHSLVNTKFGLKEPFKLKPDHLYSYEEMIDVVSMGRFGEEHGLDFFKEHGYLVTGKKKIQEAYPRPFIKPRIPIYYEHFIEAGEQVKRVTEELGLPWDLDDYQPIPDWKPCPAYKEAGDYDLFVVNFKLNFHTLTNTNENPWLNELARRHPDVYMIRMNPATAEEKGIRDGELVHVETPQGNQVEGVVSLDEGVHPQCVGIAGCFRQRANGLKISRGKGIHFNRLIPLSIDRVDSLSGALDVCVKVKVTKA